MYAKKPLNLLENVRIETTVGKNLEKPPLGVFNSRNSSKNLVENVGKETSLQTLRRKFSPIKLSQTGLGPDPNPTSADKKLWTKTNCRRSTRALY